ncbi:MAG: ABC transporter permease [Halanaerobiales bacterium]
MFLVKLALKNLTRHKKRTIITAAVIAIAIFFYIFLDSLLLGMTGESFNSIINFQSGHIQIADRRYWEEKDDLPLKNLISYTETLPEEISSLDNIQGFSPQLQFSGNLNNGSDELPVKIKGVKPDKMKEVFTFEDYFVEGSWFKDEYEVVMGKELAELMELKKGDYVTLLVRTRGDSFNTIEGEISGLLHTANPEINSSVVYVPLKSAQTALNTESKISQLMLKLDDKEQAAETAEKINRIFSAENSSFRAYTWKDSAQAVVNMGKAQEAENKIILGIILLIAAVGIVNTVLLSALERMNEIGMMKALGLKIREIVLVFSMEATGIGIIGGIAGCILGGISVGLFNRYGIDFMAYTGEELGSFGIPVMGRIYGVWNPEAFIFVFSFGVIVSLIVSIFPSWWAARKDPVDALYKR